MGEGKHRLVRLRGAGQGERARLVTPEGGAIELSREKWLRLAQVVGRMFGNDAPTRPRAPNHGQRWTASLDEAFAECWRQGEAEADLAARFGRSPGAVRQRLVALELLHPMTYEPLVERGGARPAVERAGPVLARAAGAASAAAL